MRITEKIKENKQLISFEVFPPKTDSGFESIEKSVRDIAALKPDFMSVTYGAGGGTSDYTVRIASMIKNELDTIVLAHLTCASTSKVQIAEILDDLKRLNINNILALRGDLTDDISKCQGDYYKYASELVSTIKDCGGFDIGAACYPEGHPDCASLDEDISNLKLKVDCGVDFLITQLFFDNSLFYTFADKALKKQINTPIIAGIMPITNIKQIDRICSLSGTKLPVAVTTFLEKYKNDPESLMSVGLDYAVKQIDDLLDNGVAGIHVYTMNKPIVAQTVLKGISR